MRNFFVTEERGEVEGLDHGFLVYREDEDEEVLEDGKTTMEVRELEMSFGSVFNIKKDNLVEINEKDAEEFREANNEDDTARKEKIWEKYRIR